MKNIFQKRIVLSFFLFLTIPLILICLSVITQTSCPDRPDSPCPSDKPLSNCPPPTKAWVQVETLVICYFTLAECPLNSIYSHYGLIWLTGGNYEKGWFEPLYLLLFFIPNLINAFIFHFQTFRFMQAFMPFLKTTKFPLFLAFTIGLGFCQVYVLIRASNEIQLRRALLLILPGTIYISMDVFTRQFFLPIFDQVQKALREAGAKPIVMVICEIAMTTFYASVLLPISHKMMMCIIQACHNISFKRSINQGVKEENLCGREPKIDRSKKMSFAIFNILNDVKVDVDSSSDESDSEIENSIAALEKARNSEGEMMKEAKEIKNEHFNDLIMWTYVVWDSWRFLLVRTTLLKSSMLVVFFAMAFKDMLYTFIHFGLRYHERYIQFYIDFYHPDGGPDASKWALRILNFLQKFSVRPFFMPNFLLTSVYREELVIHDADRPRTSTGKLYGSKKGSREVYEESSRWKMSNFSQRSSPGILKSADRGKDSVNPEFFYAGSRSSRTISALRQSKSVVSSLISDISVGIRTSIAHTIKNPFNLCSIVKRHDDQIKEKNRHIFFMYANELVVIKNVPKIKREKGEGINEMIKAQSAIMRNHKNWISQIVREIQFVIFNRTWPRLLLKLASSIILFTTDIFALKTKVGRLPLFQETGMARTPDGILRLISLVFFDIIEVSCIWVIQRKSKFYDHIKKGHETRMNLGITLVFIANGLAISMSFAFMRYLRKAHICGYTYITFENHHQDILETFEFN